MVAVDKLSPFTTEALVVLKLATPLVCIHRIQNEAVRLYV